MIQRRSYSKATLSAKNCIQTAQQTKKSHKAISKNSDKQKKIPQIIHDLQNNLRLLKKCYYQQHGQFPKQSYRSIRPSSRSSHRNVLMSTKRSKQDKKPMKRVNSQNQLFDDETTQCVELDELKKSFLNANGYETNNIVELYNHYKKNCEKSTGIFGSMSYTNHPNSINNFSDVHESKIRGGNSGLCLFQGEAQNSHTFKQNMVPNQQIGLDSSKSAQNLENFIKKSSQLVNVANLLAQRKKNSRDNICEKMNQQNLLVMAKKKLLRPNTSQNLEKTVTQKSQHLQQIKNMKKNEEIKKIDEKIEQLSKNKQKHSVKNKKDQENFERQSKSHEKSNKKQRSAGKKSDYQQQQSIFPLISSFKPYSHIKSEENADILEESPIQKNQKDSEIFTQDKFMISPQKNKFIQTSLPIKQLQKIKEKSYKLSSPILPKSIQKYTHSNSKSKSRNKSKQLKRMLSPSTGNDQDLNKGIIFDEESPIKRQSKDKKNPFGDNSLDGCEISVRESAVKNNLDDLSFDF